MPLDTFSPETHPDFGNTRSHKPKVLRANFGDGYSQRAGELINSDPRSWSVTWTNLPKTERDYIIDFFAARKGYIAFLYTYVDEATAKAYVCEEWDDTHEDAITYTVTAKFVEVFDIV